MIEYLTVQNVLCLILPVIFFVFGYGMASTSIYKKYMTLIDKKLLGDRYYAYAIISFAFERIDYYCGDIHIASDTFKVSEDRALLPGMYNGYAHNDVLTIVALNNENVDSIYLDISDTQIVSTVMQNSFPVMVIS